MKLFVTAALFFLSSLFYGQNSGYGDSALFLDAMLVSPKTVQYINPDGIASLNVVKRDTIIDNKHFKSQLYIISKNPEQYDFISLDQIKKDYTTIKKSDVVYMVNGELVKEDIATFKLDRNYILTVKATNSNEFYNLRKSNTKFDIINILGKTKENLDNNNKMLLRIK
jgi:hypothetical protein